MRTFKLTLAYDGTAYAGWQLQPGKPTIQAALETALHKVTGETIRAAASGRTDAGVHALGQVVSFHSSTALSCETLCNALNAELPRDIAALAVRPAADGFHARRDCIRKRYRYLIHDGPVADVFRRRVAWQYRQPLDAGRMSRAAQAFVGTHDFRSFESRWPQRSSSVRTIYEATVERGRGERTHLLACEFSGNGFLYNMVRAMVGTLVEVGRGVRPEGWPAEVIAAGARSAAGMTAPAHGLFLVRVDYPSAEGPTE
ncbi:MAG TPA: tRNA pseudouridine(38-40) synthase TruA [Pirellulales bacterium]|nr:tRNA pseudouridine(38-40) synthase TruA [Pirellulales bacterium]